MLRRRFKDPSLLALLDGVIDSYASSPGRGLPIGNLTSQFFANHYLGVLDHHCKQSLGAIATCGTWTTSSCGIRRRTGCGKSGTNRRVPPRSLGLELKPVCLNGCSDGADLPGLPRVSWACPPGRPEPETIPPQDGRNAMTTTRAVDGPRRKPPATWNRSWRSCGGRRATPFVVALLKASWGLVRRRLEPRESRR